MFATQGLFKWLATGGELTAGTARPPGFPSSSPAEGTSNRGGGTGRARGRATGKGRRDLAARSSVSGFDVDGGDGSSSSTAGTADSIGGAAIDGDSLAARALASATRPVDLVEQEECDGGWDTDSSSVDGACTTDRRKRPATATVKNELAFTTGTQSGQGDGQRSCSSRSGCEADFEKADEAVITEDKK